MSDYDKAFVAALEHELEPVSASLRAELSRLRAENERLKAFIARWEIHGEESTATIRSETLEEAAKACESIEGLGGRFRGVAGEFAMIVRALATPESLIQCDSCEEMKPRESVTFNSTIGISQCLDGCATPAPEERKRDVSVQDVQESYDRLRVKIRVQTGEELPAVRYVRCDRCEGIKPREMIDLHSASGINHCKEPCATPPPPEGKGEKG